MDMYGYKDASDEPLQSDLSAILPESLQMDGNEQRVIEVLSIACFYPNKV